MEYSACVDPKKYDRDLGVKICKERLINKLMELEAYVLQSNLAEDIKAEPKRGSILVSSLTDKCVGTVGVSTNYKDINGNKLSVGDVVRISHDGYIKESIVVSENYKPYIMGIKSCCYSDSGHIADYWTVEKIKSYKDIQVGENYWHGYYQSTIRVY